MCVWIILNLGILLGIKRMYPKGVYLIIYSGYNYFIFIYLRYGFNLYLNNLLDITLFSNDNIHMLLFYIYIYIYIYVYLCIYVNVCMRVCLCVYIYISGFVLKGDK